MIQWPIVIYCFSVLANNFLSSRADVAVRAFSFCSTGFSIEGTAQSGQSRDASNKASLEELFCQVLCSFKARKFWFPDDDGWISKYWLVYFRLEEREVDSLQSTSAILVLRWGENIVILKAGFM